MPVRAAWVRAGLFLSPALAVMSLDQLALSELLMKRQTVSAAVARKLILPFRVEIAESAETTWSSF
jgi:hypothetical protein